MKVAASGLFVEQLLMSSFSVKVARHSGLGTNASGAPDALDLVSESFGHWTCGPATTRPRSHDLLVWF